MKAPAAIQPRGHRAWPPTVLTLAGWTLLAGSYHLVLPVSGVPSPITWATAWIGWLTAILGPAYGAVRSGGSRRVAATAMWSMCGLLAAALLMVLRPPPLTVDDLYQRHRAALDQLAVEYRAGIINDDRALPLRLRFLAIDGHAHTRCTSAGRHHGCGLFLLLWQNWREEDGVGIAYFPVQPDANVVIATASGDVGTPQRELGHGWWLVH